MSVFKCKMCGGTIEFEKGDTVGTCDSCGTKQTLPRLDDDRKANLFDRANHFRRANDFDKAESLYERILSEDPTDAEAYWSLVLCRYGIEYVEDPATHRRVPTVNRAQFTSIFDDENYKSALKYGDTLQRVIYQEEAAAINDIQKEILAISQKEEPFDVFICYKETDNNGRRTPDSVLANDLYHQLTQEGFKVFFSRITLEDKLGTAYEPYIFAALHSVKVMVVLGTKPEYFNAVWVKNEWSRFLALVKDSNGKKTLIPAYKDMDPYDLPEEFSHLQAQDMSKLGFMQDLIRGIKKLVGAQEQNPSVVVKETVSAGGTNPDALLRRAFMFLEDGDWTSADEYCEKVLDQDPESAQAYLGKLMAEKKVKTREELKDLPEPFDDSKNYQKAIRFGDKKLVAELKGYIDVIVERGKETLYKKAKSTMTKASQQANKDSEKLFRNAARLFQQIPGYKDADVLAEKCLEQCKEAIYVSAVSLLNSASSKTATEAVKALENASKLFNMMKGYKDADVFVVICSEKLREAKKEAIYIEAVDNMKKAEEYCDPELYQEAVDEFHLILGYKDADILAEECLEKIEEKSKIERIYQQATGIMETARKNQESIATNDILSTWEMFQKRSVYYGVGYKEADKIAKECLKELTAAAKLFQQVSGYKNADTLAKTCLDEAEETKKQAIYFLAVFKFMGVSFINLTPKGLSTIKEAGKLFMQIPDYKDSSKFIERCNGGWLRDQLIYLGLIIIFIILAGLEFGAMTGLF